MQITIRKFLKSDIENKVKWINDSQNNKYLHYDLPLSIEKTEIWFDNNKNREDRYDAVIEADGVAVGIIGLLSIDKKNNNAEYYVTIGDRNFLGKGIAKKASILLLKYAFETLKLESVYLYVETENISAIKLYERIGFKKQILIKQDIFCKDRYVDRYKFSISKNEFYGLQNTQIHEVDFLNNNNLFIKREDFIPFSFGGNKARKALLFFKEFDNGDYDCVVTYGSSSSNHCRVVANMCAARKIKCYIISPQEASKETYNSRFMQLFGAEITVCPVAKVRSTIDNKIRELEANEKKPYFIAGGGHGNIGTQAYVDCYNEIKEYEKQNNVFFDYIFHASGTGTTQAGLVCGQIINNDQREIVGISIARKKPYGRDVIIDSIKDYLNENGIIYFDDEIKNKTIFVDKYIQTGYACASSDIESVINDVMINYGIPLDATYTGKAFNGMLHYIDETKIIDKNILFIHTGGTPLIFDNL